MKNRLTKIFMLICTLILLLTFSTGCGSINFSCRKSSTEPYEFVSGDFICRYTNSVDSNGGQDNGEYVIIVGLSKQGASKEILVVPGTINSKPVIKIGISGYMWSNSIDDSIYGNVFKKIYFPKMLQKAINTLKDLNPYLKRFLLEIPCEEFFYNLSGWFYIPENCLEEYSNLLIEIGKENKIYDLKIANLTYIVDEDVYWIDDYYDGEYVKFPKEPIKEGYVFDGWYKDQEGTDKWDEQTEKYIKPENQNTLILYGKWKEIF